VNTFKDLLLEGRAEEVSSESHHSLLIVSAS
jgi:hypothetical protein